MYGSGWAAIQRVARLLLGLITAAGGIVGGAVLLAATVNPLGLAAYPGLYAPGTIVAPLLAVCAIALFEFGIYIVRARDTSSGLDATDTKGQIASALTLLLFIVSMGYAVLIGVAWAVGEIAAGLEPTDETTIVGVVFGVYVVMRIVLTATRANLGDMAQLVGIEAATWSPDPGESPRQRNARMVVGMLFGIALLDAFLVLVVVLLMPGEQRIYPFATSATLPVALLWVVGIWTLGDLVVRDLRRRLTPLRSRAYAAIIVVTLFPALALDARVPLYPIVAGVTGGDWMVQMPFTTTSRPAGPNIAGPKLISPLPSAELPQPSQLVYGQEVCIHAPWTFTWTRDPAFVKYRLVVRGPNASVALVDRVTTATSFTEAGCGSIASMNLRGWQWQVWGITIDGRTSQGSEIRTFNVAPLR